MKSQNCSNAGLRRYQDYRNAGRCSGKLPSESMKYFLKYALERWCEISPPAKCRLRDRRIAGFEESGYWQNVWTGFMLRYCRTINRQLLGGIYWNNYSRYSLTFQQPSLNSSQKVPSFHSPSSIQQTMPHAIEKQEATDQCLYVIDARTRKLYNLPIYDGDYIRAADVGQITAPGAGKVNGLVNGDTGVQIPRSLRILDNGFQHTACMESSITFV